MVLDISLKSRKEELKQAILVRTDLKMGKGKIAAQSSHASVDAVLKSEKNKVEAWKQQGMKKVVLKVSNESQLIDLYEKARHEGLTAVLIVDAGKTQIKQGSVTAAGIGPDVSSRVDKITSKLKIL